MTQIQKIQTELDKAGALLSAATDLIKRGNIVSIAYLKDIIGDICALMKENEYADCQVFKPVLKQLSDQMDLFCDVMKKQMASYDYPFFTEG